jgi:hypothetical protein
LLYVKGSKAARYKVLKIIVLLSIQGEEKERDDDDYGFRRKEKVCGALFVVVMKW